jgi:predicted dithiol-disulfide oxidoreductase (DUF899 family)
MTNPQNPVVSKQAWLDQRKRLMAEEKELTRMRDRLSANRRALPWVRVDEPYAFERTRGKATLSELFDGRSQLVVYHLMFAPEWDTACKSCSFWADNFERSVVHLAHRDVTLLAISRAPLAKLRAFQERMGWTFEWASSGSSRFNYDFAVSFTPEQVASGELLYNFGTQRAQTTDMPGVSVFHKDATGTVFHTYSTYSRGIDLLNATYNYLDLVPKGRDEGERIMSWLRLRDSYDS